MRNVLKALDGSHLGFAKCCYRLYPKMWMAFIIWGLVAFLVLAFLSRVRSGAVSDHGERKTGFIPVGLAVMSLQSQLSLTIRQGWLLQLLQLWSTLPATKGIAHRPIYVCKNCTLVAATLAPAPLPPTCVVVMEEFPTFLLCLQLTERIEIELSLRKNSPVKSLVGLVHLCT